MHVETRLKCLEHLHARQVVCDSVVKIQFLHSHFRTGKSGQVSQQLYVRGINIDLILVMLPQSGKSGELDKRDNLLL